MPTLTSGEPGHPGPFHPPLWGESKPLPGQLAFGTHFLKGGMVEAPRLLGKDQAYTNRIRARGRIPFSAGSGCRVSIRSNGHLPHWLDEGDENGPWNRRGLPGSTVEISVQVGRADPWVSLESTHKTARRFDVSDTGKAGAVAALYQAGN